MKQSLGFVAGITILFLMTVVLWKFIEAEPIDEVVIQPPPPQREEQPSGAVSTEQGSEATTVPELPEKILPPPVPIEEVPLPPVIACAMDAKLCPDGSHVGRVAPNCEFEKCPDGETEDKEVRYCDPRSEGDGMCIELYAPVCAQVQVECITTPCDPVPQTFSNSCFACANDRVISYVEGVCEEQ
jgi:hypothetical protein